MLHPPFLLGLITGGAVIYWFTGASTQAVTTGAYRAVEFIKANIKLDRRATKASVEDSKKVVEICTQYAQKGMFNIFLTVFFSTLAFAFLEPFFFIGYLISIALFGLYQAIFMANAGGAWDNAKKIVEVELKTKGTPLHAATVVGDTVGDPFKDTSSVAMNPVIKFTTLFGLLAVALAVQPDDGAGTGAQPRAGGGVLRAFDGFRVAFVLRDADRLRQRRKSCNRRRCAVGLAHFRDVWCLTVRERSLTRSFATDYNRRLCRSDCFGRSVGVPAELRRSSPCHVTCSAMSSSRRSRWAARSGIRSRFRSSCTRRSSARSSSFR